MKAVSGYKDLMCISWSVSEITSRAEKEMKRWIQTCKWIQKKLQISDKSIRDEKVPEMMSALAELVSARNERGERSCIIVE